MGGAGWEGPDCDRHHFADPQILEAIGKVKFKGASQLPLFETADSRRYYFMTLPSPHPHTLASDTPTIGSV